MSLIVRSVFVRTTCGLPTPQGLALGFRWPAGRGDGVAEESVWFTAEVGRGGGAQEKERGRRCMLLPFKRLVALCFCLFPEVYPKLTSVYFTLG